MPEVAVSEPGAAATKNGSSRFPGSTLARRVTKEREIEANIGI